MIIPAAILAYWRVDIQNALSIRMPGVRFVGAGVLIGLSAWVPAHELNVLQQRIVGVPQAVVESAEALFRTLQTLPAGEVFLLIAVVPAVCEELLFRGFLVLFIGTLLIAVEHLLAEMLGREPTNSTGKIALT